jgi:two-component system cell cycle sensor histidine kinase/response regulator CckA
VIDRTSQPETVLGATVKALAEGVAQGSLTGEVEAPVTRTEALQGMLQLCAEALVRHLDVAFARIWTFNDTANVLELRASAGLYANIDGPYSRILLGQFKAGRIAQERAPHFTNELLTDPHVDREWVRRESMVAFAGYPLMVQHRLLGVVGMFAHRPIGAETMSAMGSVAKEISLGIERSRAAKALRESQEHIRLLLDSTAEAIYGIDMRGCCTFANPACARLLGYADPSQFLGRNMHGLIHHTREDGTPYPEEECVVFRAFRLNQESHTDLEVFWRADGSSFPAEYWSHPIRRDGEVVGSVVTFLDISERRRLEDQFRRAQNRLRDVVASSPAVLFTLVIAHDQIRSISWASDNLLEILGYPPEAAVGSDLWRANVHLDDIANVRAQIQTDLFARNRSAQEFRFRHADGGYRWIRSETRLVRDETGRPLEAVSAWSDITERKRAEEEQSRLREQLQQAQKLESVGRLAGGVAHDFNNLLTVINGYSGLLLKRLTPNHPEHRMVDEIKKAGHRATELTRQLLLLSRKQITQPVAVNLNDIIGEVEKMLTRVIGADFRLVSALSPSLGCVLADPGQLHQILMNLAVNARDAMPAGGTLLIETRNVDLDENTVGNRADVLPGLSSN